MVFLVAGWAKLSDRPASQKAVADFAISVSLARGQRPDCNCFGQVHSAPIGPRTLVRSCRRYADPCDTDAQCCSGRCNEFKSDACGCVTDADCPSNTPYCNGSIGICDTSPPS